MSQPNLKQTQKYTYADYLTWNDDKRWEIVQGKLCFLEFGNDPQNMSPSPWRKDQRISRNLVTIIHSYLRDKTCEVV